MKKELNRANAERLTGKRFMLAQGNPRVDWICPANSGLAYAVTSRGQLALVECETCTNVAGAILFQSDTWPEVQAAFFR